MQWCMQELNGRQICSHNQRCILSKVLSMDLHEVGIEWGVLTFQIEKDTH